MTVLADRLRSLLRPGDAAPPRPIVDAPVTGERASAAAEVLGGEWSSSEGGRFLSIDRRYGAGHRHGRRAVCEAAPDTDWWPALPLLAPGFHDGGTAQVAAGTPARVLFVDLETTGLAGGAGTYAFLVGCGWFEGATFRVRQLFLSHFAAERQLLEAFADLASGTTLIVTFNGKSFDLPLIENRFALHRMTCPLDGRPHLDMLHLARRMWRDDEDGCRLTRLEQSVLGHEREADVPGFEVPARYFGFVRSGDARPLCGVMEHNRQDILSLACLTAHAAQMLEAGPSSATSAREALGMGRLLERAQRLTDAACCFWQGAQLPGDADAIAENLRGYALAARRGRRHADAADAWRRLLALPECPPSIRREASEALAVHHEHRVRDLTGARQFALQSLQLQVTSRQRQAVEHRLARIGRKLETPAPAPLF